MPIDFVLRSAEETIIVLIIQIEFTILDHIAKVDKGAVSAIEVTAVLDEEVLQVDLTHTFEREEVQIGKTVLEVPDQDQLGCQKLFWGLGLAVDVLYGDFTALEG